MAMQRNDGEAAVDFRNRKGHFIVLRRQVWKEGNRDTRKSLIKQASGAGGPVTCSYGQVRKKDEPALPSTSVLISAYARRSLIISHWKIKEKESK